MNFRVRATLLTALSATMLILSACATDRTLGQQIDDAGLSASANAALAGSPTASAWDISVESNDGVVLLSGFVETEEEREEAERLVAQIDGVRDVRNNIELRERDVAERE